MGMNIGYFASFTVFLALNDADFSNAYLRPAGAPHQARNLGQAQDSSLQGEPQ